MNLAQRRCAEALDELLRDAKGLVECINSSERADALQAIGWSIESAERALHSLAQVEKHRKPAPGDSECNWLVTEYGEAAHD
jgi:hypothetical protein